MRSVSWGYDQGRLLSSVVAQRRLALAEKNRDRFARILDVTPFVSKRLYR